MYEPPADLLALDRESLETLRSALRVLPRPSNEAYTATGSA
jgi:hypothetical protein